MGGSVKWLCAALCLAAGFGLSACSDDDEGDGGGAGGGVAAQQMPLVADAGIQFPVTQYSEYSLSDMTTYTYSGGRMTGRKSNNASSFAVTSNPLVVKEWFADEEDDFTTYSDVRLNKKGFIVSAKCVYLGGSGSANWIYDDNGYLVAESGTAAGTEDGESYSWNWSSTYTWSDGNLMRLETTYVEDGEAETDVTTYTYGRADWNNPGVAFSMEQGYCGNFFGDFGDDSYMFSAGLMGYLPKNIPTQIVTKFDDGYLDEKTINEVEYNPDGSIQYIVMNGYYYRYGYADYPIAQEDTYSAAPSVKGGQVAKSLKRARRMMRR